MSNYRRNKNNEQTKNNEVTTPSTRQEIIKEPRLLDILYGRGRPIQENPGNALMIELINMNWDLYHHSSTSKEDRSWITENIFYELKFIVGSRFLKRDGDNWVEVPDRMAREKISHSLRLKRRNNNNNNNVVSFPSQSRQPQSSPNRRRMSNVNQQINDEFFNFVRLFLP